MNCYERDCETETLKMLEATEVGTSVEGEEVDVVEEQLDPRVQVSSFQY